MTHAHIHTTEDVRLLGTDCELCRLEHATQSVYVFTDGSSFLGSVIAENAPAAMVALGVTQDTYCTVTAYRVTPRHLALLSLDQLAALEAEIAAERARRAGTPLEVVDDNGDRVRPTPAGGAILAQHWATDRGTSQHWYPTLDAARAALASIARRHCRVVENDGVDLTARGCEPSWAEIRA